MKTAVICILALSLLRVSTSKAQPDRMRSPEVHLGIGFQQLIHIGGRFRVDPFIMLEADVGGFHFSENPLYTFSVGFSAVPRPAQRNPGFIYTLLYTLWYRDNIDDLSGNNWTGFMHFLTVNIGWVTQHSSGLSFLARLGGGLAIDDYRYRDADGGGIYSSDYVQLVPNLEIALGYAF
jgi:hypothetical protein